MQLTQATNEDLAPIVDLVNQAYRGAAAPGWTSEIELLSGPRIDLQSLTALAANGPAMIMVAKAGAERLGCVSLTPGDGGQWYLSMLAVNPATQTGGVGKAIMASAEQFARERGATSIKISVINLREALIAWYERRGYRQTGEVGAFPYDDPSVGTPLRDDLALVTLIKPLV